MRRPHRRVRRGLAWSIAVLAIAAAVAGCGSDDDEANQGTDPLATPDVIIAGDELCALVSVDTIEQLFDEVVDEPAGEEYAIGPLTGSSCDYVEADFDVAGEDEVPFTVSVSVHEAGEDEPADELDRAFGVADLGGSYEPVDGLGELAGFGADVAFGEFGGVQLAAVFTRGDDGYLVTVSTSREATVDQVEPIAATILDELLS